jgi:RNA polymerase sigma-70 factor (ECF subfamily)
VTSNLEAELEPRLARELAARAMARIRESLGSKIPAPMPNQTAPTSLDSKTMTQKPDRAELNRLFEEQAVPLMSTLYGLPLVRMNYNYSDAEDLLQETYIKAFRAFHQFEQGTNIKAWLTTILENTAKNFYYKSNKDTAKRGLEEMEDWQVGDAESLTATSNRSAEAEAIDNMPASTIKQALMQLPEEFRLVVYYAIVADYSYAEIAEILGVPSNTVGTRLFRGKKLLRKLLEDYARAEGYSVNPETDKGKKEAI